MDAEVAQHEEAVREARAAAHELRRDCPEKKRTIDSLERRLAEMERFFKRFVERCEQTEMLRGNEIPVGANDVIHTHPSHLLLTVSETPL